jgi:hypothetical protein
MLYDPTAPLLATGNLRRRAAVSRVVESLAIAAAAVAVIMMGLVVFSVIQRGAPVELCLRDTEPPGVCGRRDRQLAGGHG